MTYRIKRTVKEGIEIWVAGMYRNGLIVDDTTTLGLAGALTWVVSKGGKLCL